MQLCWNFTFFRFKSRELFVLSALLEEIDKKSAEHKRKLLLDRPSWLSLSWTQMNHVLLLPYLSGTENILSELSATWSRDCWREGKRKSGETTRRRSGYDNWKLLLLLPKSQFFYWLPSFLQLSVPKSWDTNVSSTNSNDCMNNKNSTFTLCKAVTGCTNTRWTAKALISNNQGGTAS